MSQPRKANDLFVCLHPVQTFYGKCNSWESHFAAASKTFFNLTQLDFSHLDPRQVKARRSRKGLRSSTRSAASNWPVLSFSHQLFFFQQTFKCKLQASLFGSRRLSHGLTSLSLYPISFFFSPCLWTSNFPPRRSDRLREIFRTRSQAPGKLFSASPERSLKCDSDVACIKIIPSSSCPPFSLRRNKRRKGGEKAKTTGKKNLCKYFKMHRSLNASHR